MTTSSVYKMTEFQINCIAWIGIGLAIIIFIVLWKFITAPFGRHTRKDFGPMINNQLGWIIMEAVSPICFLYFFINGNAVKTDLNIILASLWTAHYINRALIYPFRQKDLTKKMPLVIMFSAIGFNLINGSLNGYFIGEFSERSILEHPYHFIVGMIIFCLGMYINIRADNHLISLRQRGEKSYRIPRGFLFERISCPNHFGEIIEWLGFAIMAWNIPAFSFAVWTFANLAPRSIAHHHWYKNKFNDYPKTRKAVIPFTW